MFDLDKLSYQAYGNLVVIVLTLLALLFNLFPFNLVGLIMCIIQIPIYLIVRSKFEEPIHANGLNICFVLTILFYILIYLVIKLSSFLMGDVFTLVMVSTLNVLGCYATSTLPNKQEMKGKLFFGYKKHNESKYAKLVEFIKFNGINPKLIEAEERLKELDTQIYLIYKRKFRDNKTFKEIVDEFEIDNPRIVESLDKAYFYMIGALMI